MNSYYYILFIVFTVIASMIVLDDNVGIYITLIFKIIKVNTERFFWMLKFHPFWIQNPVGRWWMMRKYERTIRELSQNLARDDSDAL
jgi:hypothetical protein